MPSEQPNTAYTTTLMRAQQIYAFNKSNSTGECSATNWTFALFIINCRNTCCHTAINNTMPITVANQQHSHTQFESSMLVVLILALLWFVVVTFVDVYNTPEPSRRYMRHILYGYAYVFISKVAVIAHGNAPRARQGRQAAGTRSQRKRRFGCRVARL